MPMTCNEFASQVAAEDRRLVAESDVGVGIDPVTIITLITTILPLIARCVDSIWKPKAMIARRLQSPGAGDRARLRVLVRRQCRRRGVWRDDVQERVYQGLLNRSATLGQDDAIALFREARAIPVDDAAADDGDAS